MGTMVKLRCKKCGNVWEHWQGTGLLNKPVEGSEKQNMTGDADLLLCCPKCKSEDYEDYHDTSDTDNEFIINWD